MRGLAINLLFNVVLPLLAVNVLQHFGVDIVRALAISAVFPAIEVAMTAVRAKRLDALGTIVLVLIVVGVTTSLLTGDVHFALAKESLGTAIFGLLCLGSFALPRPLMFYVGRTFWAGADPALNAQWIERWQSPQFRHVMRVITAAWGIGFVIEAAVRVALAYTLPVNAVIVASPALAIAVTAALMTWTFRYGAAAERRAEAQDGSAIG